MTELYNTLPYIWLNVIYAKLNCKPMQSAVSSSGIRNLWGDCRSLLLILCLTLYLMLAFLSWSLWTCCLSESLWILAPSPSLPFCALVSMGSGEYFPLNSFSVMVPVGGCMQGWFPLMGLPWIPPCYAWDVQAPFQPLRHQFPSWSISDEFIKYLFGAFYALQ